MSSASNDINEVQTELISNSMNESANSSQNEISLLKKIKLETPILSIPKEISTIEDNTNCDKCHTVQKKLNVSRSWNRFYKEKLINIDKLLHIISEFEREKKKNLDLQLAYDQRSREWSQQQEQLIGLLHEVQPLREKLKAAEEAASEERKKSLKHQCMEQSLRVTIQQLQAKVAHMHSISNPVFVENLGKKLNTSRSENKKIKCDLEFNKLEIEELRSYISSKNIMNEKLSKKVYWSLLLAERYGSELKEDKENDPDWVALQQHLIEAKEALHIQYNVFRAAQRQKLKGKRLELSCIPGFDEWIQNFENEATGNDCLQEAGEEEGEASRERGEMEMEAHELERLLVGDAKEEEEEEEMVDPHEAEGLSTTVKKGRDVQPIASEYESRVKEDYKQSKRKREEEEERGKRISQIMVRKVEEDDMCKRKEEVKRKSIKQEQTRKEHEKIKKNKLRKAREEQEENRREEDKIKKKEAKLEEMERDKNGSAALCVQKLNSLHKMIQSPSKKRKSRDNSTPQKRRKSLDSPPKRSLERSPIPQKAVVQPPSGSQRAQNRASDEHRLSDTSSSDSDQEELHFAPPQKKLGPSVNHGNRVSATYQELTKLEEMPLIINKVDEERARDDQKIEDIMKEMCVSPISRFSPYLDESLSDVGDSCIKKPIIPPIRKPRVIVPPKMKNIKENFSLFVPERVTRNRRQRIPFDQPTSILPQNNLSLPVLPKECPTSLFSPKHSPTSLLSPRKSPTSLPVLSPKETPTSSFSPKESPTSLFSPKESPTSLFSPKETPTSSFSPKESPTSLLSPKETPTSLFSPKESPTSLLSPKQTPTSLFSPKESPTSLLSPKETHTSLLSSEDVLTSLTSEVSSPGRVPPSLLEDSPDVREDPLTSTSRPSEKTRNVSQTKEESSPKESAPRPKSQSLLFVDTDESDSSRGNAVSPLPATPSPILQNGTENELPSPSMCEKKVTNLEEGLSCVLSPHKLLRSDLSISSSNTDTEDEEMEAGSPVSGNSSEKKIESDKQLDICLNTFYEFKKPFSPIRTPVLSMCTPSEIKDYENEENNSSRRKNSSPNSLSLTRGNCLSKKVSPQSPSNTRFKSNLLSSLDETFSKKTTPDKRPVKLDKRQTKHNHLFTETDSQPSHSPDEDEENKGSPTPSVESIILSGSSCSEDNLDEGVKKSRNSMLESSPTRRRSTSLSSPGSDPTPLFSDSEDPDASLVIHDIESEKSVEAKIEVDDPSFDSTRVNSNDIRPELPPCVVSDSKLNDLSIQGVLRSSNSSMVPLVSHTVYNIDLRAPASKIDESNSTSSMTHLLTKTSSPLNSGSHRLYPICLKPQTPSTVKVKNSTFSSLTSVSSPHTPPTSTFSSLNPETSNIHNFPFNSTTISSLSSAPLSPSLDLSCIHTTYTTPSLDSNTASSSTDPNTVPSSQATLSPSLWMPSFYKERREGSPSQDTPQALEAIFAPSPKEELEKEKVMEVEVEVGVSQDVDGGKEECESVPVPPALLHRSYIFPNQVAVKIPVDDINYEILEELFQDIIGCHFGRQEWSHLIMKISKFVDSVEAPNLISKFQPFIRIIVLTILRSSPYEIRDQNFSVPPTIYKLFQIVKILERHQELPSFTFDSMVNTVLHQLILTKKLRPNSLASITTWMVASYSAQYNSLQPPHDEDRVHACRSFLIDLVFHHHGHIHEALLAALNVSKKTFIRIVTYRESTAVEQMFYWIAVHGHWEGPKTTRSKLVDGFRSKLGMHKPPADLPKNLLRSILSNLTNASPDSDKQATTIAGFLLLLKWVPSAWVSETLFPCLKPIFYEDSESTPKVELKALKSMLGSMVQKAGWNTTDETNFISKLKLFPIIK